MVFKMGELFCGPGGIGCAAMNACIGHAGLRIEHAWATDYDPDACRTYEKNIAKKTGTVICADIRELDYSILESISSIDGLSFGFPCNDFSVVGEQKGIHGTYGPLYTYGVKALKRFQPKWFLAENVGGLGSSNEGKTLGVILQAFFDAGYSVYPHLYKFEDYGIPQARHRIIIVGIRKDMKIHYAIPSSHPYETRKRTSRDAIENPPISSDAPNNELTRQSINVIERLKYIKPGENAFTAKLPPELELNVKGAKISQIYKRLDPDKPAYTITGSGGGGTHVYHWSENRALTNRERARLQTFPDDFVFCGSKEKVRKQIGMAVPVEGAKIVFESILKTFAGETYPSVEPSLKPFIHQD
jgi:DNA (cytosine-5)-methyltransferase 1